MADDGELGTGALAFCETDFDVDAFDALDDCDDEIVSNDRKIQISTLNWFLLGNIKLTFRFRCFLQITQK